MGISFSFAQNNTFKGGLTAGLTATQIDGDANGGFNKLGFTSGIYVFTDLNEKSALQFEMNYIQKGSRKKATKYDPFYWAIRLNYIELPFLYKYHYKKLYYEAGLSYGRLINQKFIYLYYQNEDQFKSNELGYLLGLSYHLSDNICFETRYSRSLLPVRDKAYFVSWLGFLGGSYNSVLQFSLKYNIGKNE